MKRLISWLAENADIALGLGLSVFVSVLGIAGVVPNYVVGNATVLALATLAFIMLRDRQRQANAARQIENTVSQANSQLVGLFAQLHDQSTVKILAGAETTRALTASRQATDLLIFKGATGTFTRAVALPECITVARRERKPLRARIEIFDPCNIQLLHSYVELYKSFAEGQDEAQKSWTVEGTQQEILATILAACWHKERLKLLLDIEVFLSSALTTFRWDLTHNSLIITQRGPRFPAILIERDDVLYSCWSMELQASMQAARRIPLDKVLDVPLGDNPDVSVVRKLFKGLGVPIPDGYSDENVNELIRKAVHAKNPYQ
jgi:hypothetical protein